MHLPKRKDKEPEMKGNKTWQRNLLNAAVATSMMVGASLAGAATQGTVGATSTGSVDLNILVPGLVLVNNLDDMFLTYTPGGGDVQATETFCVWSTPGLTYDITFDASNPAVGTDFTAVSGSTDSVVYGVEFDDWTVGTSWVPVTDNVTLDNGTLGYFAANNTTPGCTTDNAALRVTAEELGNLDAAPAGVYTDTITLIVAPN